MSFSSLSTPTIPYYSFLSSNSNVSLNFQPSPSSIEANIDHYPINKRNSMIPTASSMLSFLKQGFFCLTFLLISYYLYISFTSSNSSLLTPSNDSSYLISSSASSINSSILSFFNKNIKSDQNNMIEDFVKREVRSLFSSIEWDPQDNFNMELKSSFIIVGTFSVLLVNLLI